MSDEERRRAEREAEADDISAEDRAHVAARDAFAEDGLEFVRGMIVSAYPSSSARWSSGVLLTADGATVPWKGCGIPPESSGETAASEDPDDEFNSTEAKIAPSVGQYVEIRGRWEGFKGTQTRFVAEKAIHMAPADPAGIALMLSCEERYPGIGKLKAHVVAAALCALPDALQKKVKGDGSHPGLDKVARTFLVPEASLRRFLRDWSRSWRQSVVEANLYGLGLVAKEVNVALSRLGPEAYSKIVADPYVLTESVGFKFVRADEVALKVGMKPKDKRRLKAALRHAVLEELAEGHCWTPQIVASRSASSVTNTVDDVDAAEVVAADLPTPEDHAETVEADKDAPRGVVIRMPEAVDSQRGPCNAIATWSTWAAERGIWARVSRGDKNPHLIMVDERMAGIVDQQATDRQKDAILFAARYSMLVITGPAGCGKTFCVSAIVRLYHRFGKKVKIVAPTGKAARRLQTVLRSRGVAGAPSTIHRLLGDMNEDAGPASADHKIDADVVIMDEASMCDVKLAWKLIRYMRDDAALVLVGDHNQLPPVGAGALLRDLVTAKPCRVVHLDVVKRQAGILRANSLSLLEGRMPGTAPENADGSCDWIVDDARPTVNDASAAVVAYYEAWLKSKVKKRAIENCRLLREIQVITPQKQGPLGVESLNVALRRMVHEVAYGTTPIREQPDDGGGEYGVMDAKGWKAGKRRRGCKFMPGDKIMQTRNDYEIGLMNGYQGVVTGVDDHVLRMESEDEEKIVEVPSDKWEALAFSFASTCHKMQGSEVDLVIVVAHSAIASPLKTRNLLYTAATRAAKSVVFVGDPAGISDFVRNVQRNERRTFMAEFARRAAAATAATP